MSTKRGPVHCGRSIFSLDYPVGDDDESTLSDVIKDENGELADTTVIRKDLSSKVRACVDLLPETEVYIIKRRFGLKPFTGPVTLDLIGQELGITRNVSGRLKEMLSAGSGRLSGETSMTTSGPPKGKKYWPKWHNKTAGSKRSSRVFLLFVQANHQIKF